MAMSSRPVDRHGQVAGEVLPQVSGTADDVRVRPVSETVATSTPLVTAQGAEPGVSVLARGVEIPAPKRVRVPGATNSRVMTQEVRGIAEVLRLIEQAYVRAMPLDEIVATGLARFQRIEPQLRIERQASGVAVFVGERCVVVPKMRRGDAVAQAAFVEEVFAALLRHSPRFAATSSADRRAVLASAIVAGLDPWSAYLPAETSKALQSGLGFAEGNPPQTVVADERPHGGVAYVRITSFGRGTPLEVSQALGRLRVVGTTSAVIDLRHNAGGVLSAAELTADLFLAEGLVVEKRARDPRFAGRFDAAPGDAFEDPALRLVVLVDATTASAGEVLAGALASNGRALLVGSTTYGKGTGQHIASLPDGDALRLTVSTLHLRNGVTYAGAGLVPAVCSSRTDMDPGAQLNTLRAGAAVWGDSTSRGAETCAATVVGDDILPIARAIAGDEEVYRRALTDTGIRPSGATPLAQGRMGQRTIP
ncbi:MAG: S41 family peptidase [Myxococcota bacterium]